MIRIGIMGATGYMGGEVVKKLLHNPLYHIAWLTSRNAGKIEDFHRNLYGCDLEFIDYDKITECDAVVLSLPSGLAMELAPVFLEKGTKVVDLSADFRLKDIVCWEKVYSKKHLRPELVQEAVYGIPELHRAEIKAASLIANPGCFSSAVILGLMPLMGCEQVDKSTISVTGLSGTSGVGAELDIVAHHPEAHNNIVAYNVTGHRHTYEMEQELQLLTPDRVSIHFTPAYVPVTRGILAVCNLFYSGDLTRDGLLRVFQDYYKDEPFIKVLNYELDINSSWKYKPYPWVTSVAATNYCHIGVDIDTERNRIVIFSALDNMGKGGAHVCIENLNLMFGLEEESGLLDYGYHPC
ncbi:MAG: N-acetyl-gamma-glutamyl-phosphate reductase [Peptococcaceae bacterium]|nr:N-acetyl-gamma-glutamyl-phosphate reductase [Peptococcaceae bacterium]